MIVFILNGAPRVGKDTFINVLPKTFTKAYSSIDWVKEKAMLLGWDGKKDKKGRDFISEIKDACIKYANLPFNQTKMELEEAFDKGYDYFCINIREPTEMTKVVDYCKEEGILCCSVLIRNKAAEQAAKVSGFNSSGDTQYLDYKYDCIIHNDSTKEVFKGMVEKLIHGLKLELIHNDTRR